MIEIFPYRDDNVNPFGLTAVFNDYSPSPVTQKCTRVANEKHCFIIFIMHEYASSKNASAIESL